MGDKIVKHKGAKKHCVFAECNSDTRYSSISFLSFPKTCLDVRKQFISGDKKHISNCELCKKCSRWINMCKRGDGRFCNLSHVTKHTYICVLHFVGENGPTEMYPDPLPLNVVNKIKKSTRKRRLLDEDTSNSTPEPSSKTTKYTNDPLSLEPKPSEGNPSGNRSAAQKCSMLLTLDEVPFTELIECKELMKDSSSQTEDRPIQNYQTKSTQTTFIWHEIQMLKNENKHLKSEVTALKKTIKKLVANNKKKNSYGEFVHSLKEDDKKCVFYTGLIFKKILVLLTFLSPMEDLLYWGTKNPVKLQNRKKFTLLEELVLTLTRLRSGLLVRDLRYRFNISEGLICKICTTMIQHMYCKFNVIRPSMFASREKIKENLPATFKRLKNIRVIIDCAEFFCQTPTNFEQQGNLYSSYKAHTTFKVLLGCTPNGSVSFVSALFEGSISDKDLVKKSNLMDILTEGDLVLADRGFTIKDLTDKKHVSLNIPPFLKGRDKLTPEEEITTKNIAKERIYIEHVVGRLKQFRLLKKILPLSMRGILSNVVFVCACLMNFQEPILQKLEV